MEEEALEVNTHAENPRPEIGRVLVSAVVLCFAAPIMIVAYAGVLGVQPDGGAMLASSLALAVGTVCAGLCAVRLGRPSLWRTASVILVALGFIGSLLWLGTAIGQYPYDAGMVALERRDYSRAVDQFGLAARARAAGGFSVPTPDRGATLRVGTRGIVLYPEWDALLWLGVTQYGAGERAAAVSTLQTALVSARASGAGPSDILEIEAALDRVANDR